MFDVPFRKFLTTRMISHSKRRLSVLSTVPACSRVGLYCVFALLCSCAKEVPLQVTPLSLYVQEEDARIANVEPGVINIEPLSVRDLGDKTLSIDLLLTGESDLIESYALYLFAGLNSSDNRVSQFVALRDVSGRDIPYKHVVRSGHFVDPPSAKFGENEEYEYQLCTIWIMYRGWSLPKVIEVQLLDGKHWLLPDFEIGKRSWSLKIYQSPKLLRVIPERLYIKGDRWQENENYQLEEFQYDRSQVTFENGGCP